MPPLSAPQRMPGWLQGLRPLLWGKACLLCVCLFFTQAHAADILVLLSEDSAAYRDVADNFRLQLAQDRPALTIAVETLGGVGNQPEGESKLVLSVGLRAAQAALELRSRAPILATLVPKDGFDALSHSALAERRLISAIYLDQPYSRQLALIKLAFPERERVGVLLRPGEQSKQDALLAAAKAQRLQLVSAVVGSDNALLPALERVLSTSDVLLALPAPLLYNKNTIQSVLLTSYRYRDPLVGYSQALVRAGALVALYSTPSQIGRHAGEMVVRSFSAGTLPLPQYPKYYSVSINHQVARSLGIPAPDEIGLLEALQRWEQTQ